MKDTQEKALRENRVNLCWGFEINGYDSIPLYDVSHLFTGIRNNVSTKDAHFDIEGIAKVAKWEKIISIRHIRDTRLCPKLTDTHVDLSKINKMKVKLMSQVFSHFSK